MPRPKLQRQPCDCLDCREPREAPSPAPSTAAAVARQDPPPKSLIVCIQGALEPARTPLAGHPHLDAAVQDGWAGLLACRRGGPALPLQLLGILQDSALPAAGLLPDRFKQLRAGLLTDSADVERAGQLAGCYFAQRLQGIPDSGGKHAWPPAEQLAVRIADALSVQPPAEIEAVGEAAAQAARPHVRSAEQDSDDVIDMLILVLDAANATDDADSQAGNEVVEGSSSEHALEWADGLLRWLNHVPGFRDSVLLSLVLTPACQTLGRELSDQEQQQQVLPNTCNGVTGADFMPVRRPLQSHQAAGLQPVATDARCMAIVVHRLAGVIRVDRATALDPDHITANGGAGCILAERLLHEVAYKLGRAAKYGA